MKRSGVLLLMAIAVLTLLVGSCGTKNIFKKESVAMGTGSPLGMYYTAGLAIADIANEYDDALNVVINESEGSVYNIAALGLGEVQLALVQADNLYDSVNGQGMWKGDPQTNLRFICNLHMEAVSILTRVESSIKSVSDLRYKTISIGEPLSGTRKNALDVLHNAGISEKIDITADNSAPETSVALLQKGAVDALFYTGGQPNSVVAEATKEQGIVRFVTLTERERLMNLFPYYTAVTIPHSYYPGAANEGDIETVGVAAVLIASADLSDDIVYKITKSLFEHLSEFKERNPASKDLTKAFMIEGDIAPMHPGALRYYAEQGMVKESVGE